MQDIKQLQNSLGYTFNDEAILRQALTHRSFGKDNYERLEFVGDGVLDYVIALSLYTLYPELPEGKLSKVRAALVNQDSLAEIAIKLDVGSNLFLGDGEEKTGGRLRKSILADALEAIIAAISLDSSFDVAKKIIENLYSSQLNNVNSLILGDGKSMLQEYLQAQRMDMPIYSVLAVNGPDHESVFTVEGKLNELELRVVANGKSKKEATQIVATQLLQLIKERDLSGK